MSTETAENDSTDYDTVERVDEYENGVRLHIRSKRGTGTRDEDTVSGELYADSIDELEANREALREQVVTTLNELRHNQPDSDLLGVDDQQVIADLLQGLQDTYVPSEPEATAMVEEVGHQLAVDV
jgi:hypothetical protein